MLILFIVDMHSFPLFSIAGPCASSYSIIRLLFAILHIVCCSLTSEQSNKRGSEEEEEIQQLDDDEEDAPENAAVRLCPCLQYLALPRACWLSIHRAHFHLDLVLL